MCVSRICRHEATLVMDKSHVHFFETVRSAYQLAIVGLLWLCIMLHSIWPSRDTALPQLRTEPVPLRFKRKRANEPQPFAGLTQRPYCAACEHEANNHQ